MSGVLFMMRLWKYVDTKKLDNKSKANIFLIMNIILWSGIAFLLSFVAGVFCGYSAEWVEWTVIITGYAGIGIGFFGGVIYYMRQAKGYLSGYTRMPSQVCNTKSVLTNQAGHINSFIYGSRSFTYFAALLRRSSSIAA